MKKFIALVLAIVLVLGVCACGKEETPQGLRAGFGRKGILPSIESVRMGGSDSANRMSEGFLDEISATCVAIADGDETILLYTIDLIVVSKEVYDAQTAITEATGIPAENIILNTTHTHNSVSIRTDWVGKAEYLEKFNKALADAAVEAIADLSPAELYYGSTETDLAFVRLYTLENGNTYGLNHGSLEGTKIKDHIYEANDEMQVVKFTRAAEDKKDIVLMNLGAHATANSNTQKNPTVCKLLSGDWPAAARTYVEENSDSLCAVFEGGAGDQVPNSQVPGRSKVDIKYPEYGNAIGEFCVNVLNAEMTKAEGTGIELVQRSYTGKAINGGEKSMDLQALDVHGVSFVFAPYEMFGASAKQIQEGSPYGMTFVSTCSENSQGYHMGYIPIPINYEVGAYESQETMFAKGTAEELVAEFVDMLTNMKNGG